MDSLSDDNRPDGQQSEDDQGQENPRWNTAKLLRNLKKRRNQSHPYVPLLIIIFLSAVFGAVAVCVLPSKEKMSQSRWSRINHIADGMVAFSSLVTFDLSPEFQAPIAVTHRGNEEILVCGGKDAEGKQCQTVRYSPAGEVLGRFPLPSFPTDILVPGENDCFAGMTLVSSRYGVGVYDPTGNPIHTISAPVSIAPDQESFISAIAVDADSLFMADAQQKAVYRFNRRGELETMIGKEVTKNETGEAFPGFSPDLPYFDLRIGPDGVLWVGDTKHCRMVPFTREGIWLSSRSWGKSGMKPESLEQGGNVQLPPDEFFGNNPASFAMLTDGRFVTAERLVNRVKVFSPTGDFLTYVVAPEFFGNEFDMEQWVKMELQRQKQGDSWLPVLAVDVLPNDTVVLLDQLNLKVHLFGERI